MLKYDLKPDEINKAKQFIKKQKKLKKGWEIELAEAKAFLKTCPNKFYQSTKGRIVYAEKELTKTTCKIADLQEAIKKGYIEI